MSINQKKVNKELGLEEIVISKKSIKKSDF